MKISATTLGETAGDLLSMTMNVGYAESSIILIGLFLATLAAQMLSKKYIPFLYWLVIISTSTAGTTMPDYMDRTLGLGYAKGSMILVGLLLSILAVWRISEGSCRSIILKQPKPNCFIGSRFYFQTRWARLWAIFWRTIRGWGC